MFPLSTVLFPGSPLPLRVFEDRYRTLVSDAMASERSFGVVLIARGSEVGGGDQRLAVGTLADIEALSPLGGGQLALLARGRSRIHVTSWLEDDPYPHAVVEPLGEDLAGTGPEDIEEATKKVRTVRALLSELHDTPPLPADLGLVTDSAEALLLAQWALCALSPFDAFDRQRLLETEPVATRLALLGGLCDELAYDLAAMLSQGGADL